MAGITVGVDGSHHAHRALEWAIHEAVARQVPLTVVAVHPVMVSGWTGYPVTLPPDRDAVEAIRQAAEELVAKAVARLGGSQPPSVTVQAMSGAPADELIKASRDADLLVVGSHGSGFTQLVLGSISNKVVHHASCAVVVVPGDS